MTGVALACMILAVARVTRLVTTDDVTSGWRSRLTFRSAARRPPNSGSAWYVRLIYCDWCVSVWIAAIAAPLGKVSGLITTWQWVPWAFVGMAGGSGLVTKWADR